MPNFPVKTWIPHEGPDFSRTPEPPYGCPKLPMKAAISRGRGISPSMPGSLTDAGTSLWMPTSPRRPGSLMKARISRGLLNLPVDAQLPHEGRNLSWTRNLPVDVAISRGRRNLPVDAQLPHEDRNLSWTRNLPFDAAISHGRGTSPSMLRSLADAGTSPSMPRSLADAAISREGPGFSW